VFDQENNDIEIFLNSVEEVVKWLIRNNIKDKQLKINFNLRCIYRHIATQVQKEKTFHTENTIYSAASNLLEKIKAQFNQITEKIDLYEQYPEDGSQFVFDSIICLEISINKYQPLNGKSYIDLPIWIRNKKAVVNVKNNDNECFAWSITAAENPNMKHPERVSKLIPHRNNDLFKDIEFPVPLDERVYKKFENQTKISINVYTVNNKDKSIDPAYITENEQEKHVDLLFLKGKTCECDNDCDHINFHYCWIKNMSRLVNMQVSNHNGATFLCKRCLYHLPSQEILNIHKKDCKMNAPMRIKLPETEDKKWVMFVNHQKQMKVPFVAALDIESLLKQYNYVKNNQSYYQKHEALAVGYIIYCSNPELYFKPKYEYFDLLKYKSEENLIKGVLNKLIYDTSVIYSIYFANPRKMIELTDEEIKKYNSAKTCHICEKEFTHNDFKVQDHCHLTGYFRGAAHKSCNLNYKLSNFLPVFVHNLGGYDSHMLIKEFGLNKNEIKLIPKNEEKYITFSKKINNKFELRFLDSYNFMSESLDQLTKNLGDNKPIMKSFIANKEFNSDLSEAEQFNLLTRKGVFPYDYIDSLEKLDETELPPIKVFYNKLNDESCSIEDYNHAQKVWRDFKCQTILDYMRLYLKTDVILLLDVVENYRDTCIKSYGLDPAWYFSAPGLSWDALLKMSNVKLQLLTDPDMLLMFEKAIRGGISQVCGKKYAKANNKYLPGFDSTKPSTYIIYLDANNLYGKAMNQYLPTHGFRWLTEEEIMNFDVMKISDTSEKGYLPEISGYIKNKDHEKFKDYPLAFERKEVGKTEKLLGTLDKKENYSIHYRALKYYISKGFIVTKIHRVIEFYQSPWMKLYIEENTKRREAAKNKFEKNFFKLMNNSVFGKTMENIRNRQNIKLCCYWNKARKLIAKPLFKTRTIFKDNLVAIHMNKKEIFFNKPIYVGQAILDLSKEHMYKFHYDHIKKKYGDKILTTRNDELKTIRPKGDRVTLLYTDTDAFIYEIQTEDIYKDMKEDEDLYDFSDYPKDHFCYSEKNKKVLGKMKDELADDGKLKIISEAIFIRAKVYDIKAYDFVNDQCLGEEKEAMKKSKGTKKCVTKNKVNFEDYYNCLFKNQELYRTQNLIKSKKHEVFTIEQNKLVLSPFDDKRLTLPDGINTIPFGHYNEPYILEFNKEMEFYKNYDNQLIECYG
jgi:hypothetical protein